MQIRTATSYKHPSGLWYMAVTYALLMFAYIGINTLLVLYAANTLKLKTSDAYLLYAAYNSLIFTLPLIGGYLGDKFGHKNAAAVGLLLSIMGTFIICLHNIALFYIGIATFVVGYGMCTPAFFCLVGLMYPKEDRRLDSAYTNFYFVFNAGSFLASVSSGYISQFLGYSFSFSIIAEEM